MKLMTMQNWQTGINMPKKQILPKFNLLGLDLFSQNFEVFFRSLRIRNSVSSLTIFIRVPIKLITLHITGFAALLLCKD